MRSGAAPLFSRRTLAPHAAQNFAPSMSVFPQLMQYMGVTRPTLRRGDERATDSDADDGCNHPPYRWRAGGAMRGLRHTRVRGVPLAGEALGFDGSFRQRLDVLACRRGG